MEFAGRSRQTTAAADDVENGRHLRFPDLPPPPPQGDANVSPVDAALARRREELLFELHKARVRQDMIFRELVETELTMGITAADHNPVPSPQDYWRNRPSPSVPPLEEPPLRPSPPRSSTERSPSGSRGPARPVKAPPLYPHVEWPSSSSPLLQPRPASDTEKQQDSRSSGTMTRFPFDGYAELRRSPNKPTLPDKASLPVAANAGARPIFHGEVTPVHKHAAGGEYKVDVEDSHDVQPSCQSGNQSIGQGKTSETTLVEQINAPMLLSDRYRLPGQESAAFDQQKSRGFTELKPEQPRLGNGDEQKAGVHAFNGNMELCLLPYKQAPVEETLVPVAAKANNSPMQSALSLGEAAAPGHQRAFGGEPKANAVDAQGDIRNQRSRQMKVMESALEGRTDKPAQPPGQHRPAGQENAAYNEKKKVEFSETTPERTSNGLKRKLADSAPLIKKQKPYRGRKVVKGFNHRKDADVERKASWKGKFYCELCDVQCNSEKMLASHLGGRKHRERLLEGSG